MLTIDLLRHGDVEGGTRLLGHTDLPLSELGWVQLRGVVENKNCPWTQIIASPLQRCRSFAEELAEEHTIPISIEPNLKEISFGEWEGERFADLYAGNDADAIRAFWHNPSQNPAPGGEKYAAFEERVLGSWDRVITATMSDQASEEKTTAKHVLLVVHGGVIRALLRGILHFPTSHFFRLDVPYACLSRVVIENGIARVVFHGGQLDPRR